MTDSRQPTGEGMNRRDIMKAVGGYAVALALAGCAELIGGDDVGTGGSEDVSDSPIEAGLQTFIEEPAAVLGLNAQAGAETAVRRINNADGVAGREIQMDVVLEDVIITDPREVSPPQGEVSREWIANW